MLLSRKKRLTYPLWKSFLTLMLGRSEMTSQQVIYYIKVFRYAHKISEQLMLSYPNVRSTVKRLNHKSCHAANGPRLFKLRSQLIHHKFDEIYSI